MNLDYTRIAISGAGFLADAYDLFVINIAVDLMDRCNYRQPLLSETKASIKALALAGAVVGQLGFGAVADLIGRRTVFIITCALVMLGALMSATVVDSSAGIYNQLCFWRFVLGVGVGGEYPLSASITSESSHDSNKARNLAMVFCMQGIGTVLCSLVLVTITTSFGYNNYDAQWRIALGLGGLPMAVAFYFRWKMHETSWKEESEVYRKEENLTIEEDTSTGNEGVEGTFSVTRIQSYCLKGWSYWCHVIQKNAFSLTGTAGAWFLLDIVFYANGLFSGEVVRLMGVASSPKQESVASLYLQLLALPGYFFSIGLLDRIGLLRLQLFGFLVIAVLFLLLAILQPYLVQVPPFYVILYGLTFFFQNFGANATTYIIPSIIYTSAERATCHGISSAAGKLGALFGTFVFLYTTDIFCAHGQCTDDDSSQAARTAGLQLTFGLCGIVAIIGWCWSYYFVTDQPAASLLSSQEELHAEKQRRGISLTSLESGGDEGDDDDTKTIRLYEMIDLQSSMSQHSLLVPSQRSEAREEDEEEEEDEQVSGRSLLQSKKAEKGRQDPIQYDTSDRTVSNSKRMNDEENQVRNHHAHSTIGDDESSNPLLTDKQTIIQQPSMKSSTRSHKKKSSKSKNSKKKSDRSKYRVDYDDDEMAL